MPRAPVRDRMPLSEAHGTTVLKFTGRRPLAPNRPSRAPRRAPDLRRHRCHIFVHTLLCKRSVHRYSAYMTTPTSLSARGLRRAHRHPPRRRHPARAGAPAALAAAVHACASVAPPPPPTSPPQLGTNSGATSYHLRKLEAVGLVERHRRGRGQAPALASGHRLPLLLPERLRRRRGLRDRPELAGPRLRAPLLHPGRALGRRLAHLAHRRGRTPAAAATTWSCSPPSS